MAQRGVMFAGVIVHSDGSTRYKGEWQDTSACHATVDSAGSVRDRATVTRMAGGALVAGPVGAVLGALFRKRVDEREVYLIVTGDRYDWVVPVRPAESALAHRFAAELNTRARQMAEVEAGARR